MQYRFWIAVAGVLLCLAAAPVQAKNPVGNFFNKVGDAIKKNPLTNRQKRQKPPSRAQTGEPALEREARRQIQNRLNELGYDVGAPDGIFGNGTRRGISLYQAATGAEATGYLTQSQANTLLSGSFVPAAETPADQDVAKEKAAPVATGRVVMTIAGPDAVWSPAAMHGCRPQDLQDMLNCMARFGAPREAVEFVRQSAETGIEPGLLSGLQDFGTVDLARLDYIRPGREQALVLVNGGPAAVATENDGVQALPLDDPVFRRLVSRYGELKLFNDPRLESHRLMTRGEQRFTFAYRLAKCDTCATPGEMLVAFDFDAAGHYSGLTLLGITGRDPDQDWLAVNRPQEAVLQSDMAKLQRRLAGLGFEPGALDGEGGKQTETALLAVQADHGLKQSGEADERTVRLLAAPDIIVEVSRFEQIYTIATEPELVAFALRYGRGVLSRAQNALGESNVAVARMNSRVGRLYDRQKNYARALPFARKAVEVNIAAGLDKSQGHGLLLFNLGETLRQLGRKDEAVEKFEAAFDLFEPLATAGRDGQESDLTERNLAADALNRTGQKLIALYSQQERSWSVKRVKKRLETVEAQLAAAD